MTDQPSRRVSRRGLLWAGGGATAALGAGAAIGAGAALGVAGNPVSSASSDADPGSRLEPFYGVNQSGIVSARQSHAAFAAFTLLPTTKRGDAARMMRLVSDDAARLTQAQPALGDPEPDLARLPARLTITFGFGPTFFTRLGLQAAQPEGLVELPRYTIDRLQPRYGGGDLIVQIGADDPMAVAHALRQLTRTFRSFATRRWVQRGFTAAPGGRVRNLMGLIDGSSNPKPDEPDYQKLVWSTGSPAWFAGGTTLVFRRIAMTLGTWDELDTSGKELAVGRRVATGAPLTGNLESDVPDLQAVDTSGLPVIPAFSHVARAKARTGTERFLRRSYSYDDSFLNDDSDRSDEDTGTGLLFASYQADIASQYLPVQQRLAENDAMNAWTVPIGSAVVALPPGCQPGGYIGEGLLT